jgi:hypothetical protein
VIPLREVIAARYQSNDGQALSLVVLSLASTEPLLQAALVQRYALTAILDWVSHEDRLAFLSRVI